MKQFVCGELVPGCEHVFQGGSDEEILEQVEVHAREAEVLHRQVAEPGQRALGRERAARDLVEQRSYFFAIHRRVSLALPLRKPWRSRVTK